MAMKRLVLSFAVLTVILGLPLSAHAQSGSLTRSFVSSSGVDTNACTIAAPCATFAQAYTKIGPNGIIAALDPGKYGPITITTGVTINGNGWSAITAPAAGNGVTVAINNATGGNVTLSGLEIDGAGAGYNGIQVSYPVNLIVKDCTLQNFVHNVSDNNGVTGNGIVIMPAGGALTTAVITHTTASNNGEAGIAYIPQGAPSASINIDHVVANANTSGISVFASGITVATGAMTITDTITNGNTYYGVAITQNDSSAVFRVSIDNLTAAGNETGIYVASHIDGPLLVLLGRSVITNNGSPIFYGTHDLYSYGDNRVDLNSTLSAPFNHSFTTQ
jgi:hypothetical protein